MQKMTTKMNATRRQIWLSVAPAMVLPFIGALVYFVLFSESFLARVIYTGTKLFTVIWPVVAISLLQHERFPRPQILTSRNLRSLPLGLLTGLGIVLVMFLLMHTGAASLVESGTDRIRTKATDLGVLDYYWLLAFCLSFVNSLVEEYYWRWFLFGQLARVIPRTPAHLLAGLAFASHHIVITTQFFSPAVGVALGLAVGIGGIIWSWMYDRQQTIAGSWLSHIIVDLGIFAIGHRLLFGTFL